LNDAVILTDPSVSPVTKPPRETRATSPSDVVHTTSPVITLPALSLSVAANRFVAPTWSEAGFGETDTDATIGVVAAVVAFFGITLAAEIVVTAALAATDRAESLSGGFCTRAFDVEASPPPPAPTPLPPPPPRVGPVTAGPAMQPAALAIAPTAMPTPITTCLRRTCLRRRSVAVCMTPPWPVDSSTGVVGVREADQIVGVVRCRVVPDVR
jgi:hypothetical protein